MSRPTNTGAKYVSRIPQGFYLVRVPGEGRPFCHFRTLAAAVVWRNAMLDGELWARRAAFRGWKRRHNVQGMQPV